MDLFLRVSRSSGGFRDINNNGNPRGEEGNPLSYTGVGICFINVNNLTVRDLTIHNPDAFFMRIGEVRNFLIENITLSADSIRLNQDGIHVGGFSENGIIRGIKAYGDKVPNDDMIALNADDDVERVINLGMRRGPIRNILIEDIEAEDAYTFIRLLSCAQPIEDITVRRMRGTCRVHGINFNNWKFPKGSGNIKRIKFEDIEIRKTEIFTEAPAILNIFLNVKDLEIKNLKRNKATTPKAQTIFIDNQASFDMRLNGKTLKVQKERGFSLPDGDIKDLKI